MNFKKEVAKIISKVISDFNIDDIEDIIEIPTNTEMGDFAFPCFKLAKVLRKAPNAIASDLVENITIESPVVKVENVGGYVNFFIDKSIWADFKINEILQKGKDFGRTSYGENKNTIIEFSSPNIAKPFHIGHIRTTVIGHSLYRIYDFLGFNAIAINHLGDYGTQFGKLIVAIKNWSDKETISKNPIEELLKIYVKFHDEAEKNPELEDEARMWFKKLEDGDEKATELWQWIRDISLLEFKKVYDLFDIEFDSYAGESFYSDKMQSSIDLMKEKGILEDSDGAKIVNLEEYNMPPALIKKKDGSTLYITRDIAAAIYRKNTYDFYKNVYVVGAQQELHFRQWKKVVELMGFDWAKDCEHVQFGTVSLADGTLSTRRGKVVFLEDVLNKAIEKTKEIIIEKNPNLENIDEVAKTVGVGAVVFQELSNSRIKDYQFSWEKTLSFEGETGPYVQYAHARCSSILSKSSLDYKSGFDANVLAKNPEAVEVVRVLSSFEDVIFRAYSKNEPHHIARFALDLAQSFNRFYHDNQILTDDENTTKSYLALVECVRIGLQNSLYLLGINSPKKM